MTSKNNAARDGLSEHKELTETYHSITRNVQVTQNHESEQVIEGFNYCKHRAQRGGPSTEPPAAASRSRRAWLCEPAVLSMPAFVFLSISDWAHAIQSCLDAVLVVISYIFMQLLFEVFNRLEVLKVEQFRLQKTEEVLHHRNVQAVALPRSIKGILLRYEHIS